MSWGRVESVSRAGNQLLEDKGGFQMSNDVTQGSNMCHYSIGPTC